MSRSDIQGKRLDGFGFLAFCLAVCIMVCPTEADLLYGLLAHDRRMVSSSLVAITCFTIVLVPTLVSLRRHWQQPGMWKGRGYLVATALILATNVFIVASVFIHRLVQ